MGPALAIQCVLRGTNMVKEGIQVIKIKFDSQIIKYYIQPTRAHLNNKPEFRNNLPADSENLRVVMPKISEILAKASLIVILGDPSPINYYLDLCELPKMFSRNNEQQFEIIPKPTEDDIKKYLE